MPRKPVSKPKTQHGNGNTQDPYPHFGAPTPEQCRSVRDSLLSLHGFPAEFAEFRRSRLESGPQSESESESVLDGVVITLLSQNTTDANSRKAFQRLKSAFPTWDEVLDAESDALEDAIRCGGLARTKAARIKALLQTLKLKGNNKNGLGLCLEYLRDLPVHTVKAELSQFKGIGPKTVACVLMFYLHKDDFPVDTHVFQITKAIGWIPRTATRETAYLHLNNTIPNELKFDLNCLLVTHGKLCRSCKQQHNKSLDNSSALCPLVAYANVNKQE
ncbi:DEMETER-like protein 2 [Rhynchospora pubera]|uniref:DEMETER-like protein 2 n=1 Tax=Rhynchospora pubera TaxID=906938 RepID=A0AAV8CM76_9POAL|nr:DEMETER-like protein 2 [Rhynchospora pubera]